MKLTKQDLEIILQEGEGHTIEFKESFTSSIAQDIVAFTNATGGRIFIGVDDSGKVNGINITNSLKSQITDIARNCDPQICVNLQTLGNVLIVNVEEGSNKPYQCKDGFFLRQGPNSQKLTRDQIIQFYIDETKIRFDTQFNPKFRYPEDFDKNLFRQYLQAIKVNPGYKA
ncbi:MAG: putative DNA binding domain-containing protein, partial [Planctomycetes bacterium]|nr:putative DNA binding domain-containing protein [Planctomycetota bacterium]